MAKLYFFKGQVALEYMAIVGLSLAILIPLLLYVNAAVGSTREELQVSQARNSLARIRDAADAAFVEGPPARFLLSLNFPEGIESTSVSGQEVSMRVLLYGGLGESDAFATTIGNVSGSIPSQSGLVRILVKAEFNATSGENYVNVTELQ